MKDGIHPEYKEITVTCSCGNAFHTRSTLGHDLQTLAGPALDAHLSDRRLVSIGTAKQGLSLEVVYDVHFRAGKSPDSLVRDLNRIEGMQSVEVRARQLD